MENPAPSPSSLAPLAHPLGCERVALLHSFAALHCTTCQVNPLEAGLSFAVDWDKPGGFIGQAALAAAKVCSHPNTAQSTSALCPVLGVSCLSRCARRLSPAVTQEVGASRRCLSFQLLDPNVFLWGGESIYRDGGKPPATAPNLGLAHLALGPPPLPHTPAFSTFAPVALPAIHSQLTPPHRAEIVGFLTSAAYGHSVGGAVGLGLVERKLGEVGAPKLAVGLPPPPLVISRHPPPPPPQQPRPPPPLITRRSCRRRRRRLSSAAACHPPPLVAVGSDGAVAVARSNRSCKAGSGLSRWLESWCCPPTSTPTLAAPP